MRIYTPAGDLAFRTFNFPDQQPHFVLETYELDFRTVTIEAAIRSPQELMEVLLANDVLRQHGYEQVNLDIRYLLGARMDRAISSMEPFTLQLVARLINGAGFTKVRVLDCHSEVGVRLIRNCTNVLPSKIVRQVLDTLNLPAVVVPDKGAVSRVESLLPGCPLYYAEKVRDQATGALSGFKLKSSVVPENVLIIDDLCDGGGTFVGLAKVLREAGARSVAIFVTHGIFSKGTSLEGIDRIFTTDSYFINEVPSGPITIIPISMKEMT